jgi:hypothetical protein
MIFAQAGLGATTPYACSAAGNCKPLTASQLTLFKKLQTELNRVRVLYGLPPDVTVDGEIGAKTLAKLIKLSEQFIKQPDSQKFDRVFDKYGLVTGAMPTTAGLAADALNVTQALTRDGLTMQHYWAREDQSPPTQTVSVIDPYLVAANTGTVPRPKNPMRLITVPVGPTSQGPVDPSIPPPRNVFWTQGKGAEGLAIAGFSLLGLLVVGTGVAIYKGVSKKKAGVGRARRR